MVARRPSWILNIKVCYRYISATTGWIVFKFCIRIPLGPSCATSLFYSDLKTIMAARWPSWILNIKVCYHYFSATTGWIVSKFCIRIPLGALVVQHHFFIQIWTKIWSSGGHLEFWTSKFVTAISQQLLDGFFPIFVCRFPLGPSCSISLFYSHLKTNMATRRPSWILNIKVCYRYFSATTVWIVSKFCIQISLRP